MCDILVCGVVSDAECKKFKGPPVMNQQERGELARACKWVDEVVIADTFSVWANLGFDEADSLTFIESWATSLSYTFHLKKIVGRFSAAHTVSS